MERSSYIRCIKSSFMALEDRLGLAFTKMEEIIITTWEDKIATTQTAKNEKETEAIFSH